MNPCSQEILDSPQDVGTFSEQVWSEEPSCKEICSSPVVQKDKPMFGSFIWLMAGLRQNHWDGTDTEQSPEAISERKTSVFSTDAVLYRRRGEALHQLLDELPCSDPEHWHRLAWHFLHRQGLSQQQALSWAKRVVNVLCQPALKPLFFKAKSEVEWCGPGHIRRMDRVLVGKTDVWIIDFKSDGRDLLPWFAIPYKDQMQRYANLMHPLYPTKYIHQGILWIKQGALQWHPESRPWSENEEF